MQMVILCGGLATRLGDLAKEIPKSMMDIYGKPFLYYQLENLKQNNIYDIVLCVGHLSNKIIEYFGDGSDFGINIKYSYDGKKQLGPIGAIKKAEKLLEKEFFIMYGDSYLSVDFQNVYHFFKSKDKLACMIVYKNCNKYDKSNLVVKDEIVVGYGSDYYSDEMIYIDYGSSLLSKKCLNYIPKETFYSTGEFFSDLINKKQLLAFEAKNRFYHIGNPKALDELRLHIKSMGKY